MIIPSELFRPQDAQKQIADEQDRGNQTDDAGHSQILSQA
jgi:hypothetical protein